MLHNIYKQNAVNCVLKRRLTAVGSFFRNKSHILIYFFKFLKLYVWFSLLRLVNLAFKKAMNIIHLGIACMEMQTVQWYATITSDRSFTLFSYRCCNFLIIQLCIPKFVLFTRNTCTLELWNLYVFITLIYSFFAIVRRVLRTQSNIYEGALFGKVIMMFAWF